MLFTTALLTLLPALAFAQLHPPKGSVYAELLTIDSGTDLQYASINATGGSFVIGKPANTYCPPEPGSHCHQYPNITTVGLDTTTGRAYMLAEVPGGQDVYVQKDGALSFTLPHSEGDYPPGSILGTFTYMHGTKGEASFLGFKHGKASKFYACQVQKGLFYYNVFVNVPGFKKTSNCREIGILASNVTEIGAFQYD